LLGIQKGSRPLTKTKINQRDSPSTTGPSQDPFPRPSSSSRPKTQDGMVKLLPIPSLKKVRITKTKSPTKKWSQDSPRNLLTIRHEAPERSWSSSLATSVPICPKKEMIPWLCTSIASALRIRPRGKKSSRAPESPQKELFRERINRSARIVLGL